MKKTAFFYPGQGSQLVGMGTGIADAFPEAKDLFDRASGYLGYDLYALCAEGPIEKLSDTRYTQPAMFTVEAAITRVFQASGVTPYMAAGHSLGEFAAWYAAGVYSFEDGLSLVTERGRLMAEADPELRGGMAAVIGLSSEDVAVVCGSVEGEVVLANVNSAQQMVISGEKGAVVQACDLLSGSGAKRVVHLKVSGAFHSPMMAHAREAFAPVVDTVTINDARIPVYANATALPVTETAEIRRLMVEQLTSPVHWVDTVTAMRRDGLEGAYEIGPSAVIAGLVKRIDRDLPVMPVGDAATIREVLDATT